MCKFSIASKRRWKEHGEEEVKETAFFDVVAQRRLAEVCGEYLKRGRGVRVVGRLKQEEGTPVGRRFIYIMAEHVEFKPQVKKQEEKE